MKSIQRKSIRSVFGRRGVPRAAAFAAAGAAGLLTATLAFGGQSLISLTSSGPQPNTVTVQSGDTVSFVNNDSSNHSIISTVGGFTSPVILPGQTYSVVVGGQLSKLPFEQTGFSHSNFRGQIVLQAPNRTGQITLRATRPFAVYGASLVMSGHAALAPGSTVALFAQPAGQKGRTTRACATHRSRTVPTSGPPTGWVPVGAPVSPGADGTFAFLVRPTIATAYLAESTDGAVCSSIVPVLVKPVLTIHVSTLSAKTGSTIIVLTRLRPAAAAQAETLSRFDAQTGSWRKVASGNPSVSGLARFTLVLPSGRTHLEASTGGRHGGRGGYEPASSRQIVVTGVGSTPVPVRHKHRTTTHKKKH